MELKIKLQVFLNKIMSNRKIKFHHKKRWTDKELNILRIYYPIYGFKKVSELTGRQRGSINKIATRFKIKVDYSIFSHPTKGKKRYNLCNERNGQWKGDKVGYTALHNYVKRRLKRPIICQKCLKISRVDLANISGKYKRDLSDWEWLCRKCHMEKDGRLYKLVKTNHKKYDVLQPLL